MSESEKTITLNTGSAFPTLGLGCWKIPKPLCGDIVQEAIQAGVRHFDCACDYGNEAEIGAGLRTAVDRGLTTREDVWVTSKLWNTYHEPKYVRAACERSLKDLQLDVLDLYLVHFPIALAYVPFEERYPPEWLFDPNAENPAMKPISVPYADTWGAMEELVDAGLVKNIGVCNLNISLLRDVLSYARIRPAVHQVELHPYLTQERLLRYCQQEHIAVTAFSPLGADSYIPLDMASADEAVMRHATVIRIAEAHGKSPAQVVLRWAVQRGTVPIPKTQTPARLSENINIYDFSLTEAEMTSINALDQKKRFNDPGHFGEIAFNTFYPIFD